MLDIVDERATGSDEYRASASMSNPSVTAEDRWDYFEVKLPPRRLRIAPGIYEAVSASLRVFSAFDRQNLEIGFDVFEGEAMDGVVLARIPKFLRKPPMRKPLPQNSDFARLFYLLGLNPRKVTGTNVRVLRGKLWRAQGGDAERDSRQRKLAENETYSVVKRIVERL
jgi:hypothetical protein